MRNRFRSLSMIAVNSFLAGTAWSACPDPGPNEVVVWKDGSFAGTCRTLAIGAYPQPSNYSPIANESISSLKVGSNVRAVLFKDTQLGGQQSLYESGAYDAMGYNENDTTSSILVLPANGTRATFRYLGDNPYQMSGRWATEAQGLAHSDTNWYVNQRDQIWQFDIGADLGSDPAIRVVGIPQELSQRGCNHFGDTHFANNYLLVPVDGCSDGATIAVFDADLNLICYDQLYRQSTANWLAVHPTTGFLYSSNETLNGEDLLIAYSIDWSQVYPDSNPHWILWDPPPGLDQPLKHRDGTPVDLQDVQGGVFSDDGTLFYLSNGYYDCEEGADGRGLRVFNASTGVLIANAGNDYGYFNYEFHCGFLHYEEPEGIDYVNMDVRPGPYWGQLHAVLLKNWYPSDQIILKHYSIW
jgi:hypothetical protein